MKKRSSVTSCKNFLEWPHMFWNKSSLSEEKTRAPVSLGILSKAFAFNVIIFAAFISNRITINYGPLSI